MDKKRHKSIGFTHELHSTIINHILVPGNTISNVECTGLGWLYRAVVLIICHNIKHAKTYVVCVVIREGSYQ